MRGSMVSTLEAEDRGTATSDRKGNLPVMQSIGAFILAAIEALCVVYLSVAKAGFILAAAAVASSAWSTVLHRDIIRIPMLLVSTLGALVNLYLLWKAHRLRNAPAAAWRRQPLKKVDRWRIGVVLASSLLALGLTAMEIFFHRIIHHTLV